MSSVAQEGHGQGSEKGVTRSFTARLAVAGIATFLVGGGVAALTVGVGGAPGGVTRLVAGSPTATAVATNLTPNGTAVDAAGDLFVSDASNHVVDEITPSGVVSVVAGTPGISGRPTQGLATKSDLGTPAGLAVGANQQLYIADPGNAVIEAVDLQTGMLSIVAGVPGQSGPPSPGVAATSSELYFPTDVAFYGTNLYIADALAEVVEAVDVTATTPTLSIVAGQEDTMLPPNCTPQLSPPFVQCSSTPAGNSGLFFPEAVAVDGGNLYIADTGEHVIEKDSGGTISIVAGIANQQGSPTSPFGPELGDPSGLAVDGQGNLYIADPTNHVVEELSNGNLTVVAGVPGVAGAPTNGPATSSDLNGPGSVAIDGQGNLYIGDTDANLVERVTGGNLSVFAGTGTGVACPFSSPLQATLNADVTIPADASCAIATGGRLNGNVTIDGGKLSLEGGAIQGDVTVENTPLLAGVLDTSGGTITGTVQSSGVVDLTARTTVSASVESSGGTLADDSAVVDGDLVTNNAVSVSVFGGATVEGSLQIHGTKAVPTVAVNGCPGGVPGQSATNVIGQVTVDGNLSVTGNGSQAPFDIADCAGPVSVHGDVQVNSNAAQVTIGTGRDAASVGGNLVVEGNTGGGEVAGNQIGGSCQIDSNQPTIIGATSNTVQSGGQAGCNLTAPVYTPPSAPPPPSTPAPPNPTIGSSGRVISAGPFLAAAPGGGYWLTAQDGTVTAYDGARSYGSPSAAKLDRPVVGMAATPDGHGYWLVGADGGVFAYGDAGFYGSAAASHLDAPIVGMAATPDGHGYWLVGADGGVFAYGDAGFYGSAGNIQLDRPVIGLAPARNGGGYWLVGADGGVFSYGDAGFFGSSALAPAAGSAAGIEINPTDTSYSIIAGNGTSHTYPG